MESTQLPLNLSPMEKFKAAERAKEELERKWKASAAYKDFMTASTLRKQIRGQELRNWETDWKIAFRTGYLVARHRHEGAVLEPHTFREEIETPEEAARMDSYWKRHLLKAGSKLWLDEVKEELRAKEAWMKAVAQPAPPS